LPDELPLAVASHATSKITSAEDLFRVGTLGFRGEALASIAAVSRFAIRSRPHDRGTEGAPAGAELEVVGGEPGETMPVGCPPGTIIEIRNLFFNTPVRRKFLRTTQTEMGHVTEAFTRLALAYPGIHFVLRHNGKTVHDLPRAGDPVERIARFFGNDLAEDLIPVESTDGAVQLAGHVAHPSHSRANRRWQYLFLNGRSIRDAALSHSLSEAYRGLLLSGRYPICFLHIAMPTDSVDVNVHPTKQEVRFQDGGKLYSQLLGMLRTKFLTSDLKSRAAVPGDTVADDDEVERAASARSELVDWAKNQLAAQTSATSGTVSTPPASDTPAARTQPGWLGTHSTPEFRAFPSTGRPPLTLNRISPPPGGPPAVDAATEAPETGLRRDARPSRAIQIHNRYLVVETAEGVEVIDQHALHERILYEQLRERVLDGAIETQRLLVPEPVDLAAAEAAAVLESRDLLAELGVEVEPFGGETVLVSAYPAMLANISPADVLRDLVEHLVTGGKSPDRRDLLDDLLHMIACKAAVKYGDRLTIEEIDALLIDRHLAHDHHHCPHGRPTALVFTREDLDRQFKRI
jgi:DNA mismatch repair protein MutL